MLRRGPQTFLVSLGAAGRGSRWSAFLMRFPLARGAPFSWEEARRVARARTDLAKRTKQRGWVLINSPPPLREV